MILVTGGAGFIGSNFVLDWLEGHSEPVAVLDGLTYAGNLENLESIKGDRRLSFIQGDVCDGAKVRDLFAKHRPRAVIHFAAESHVDRSIHGPAAFIRTNIEGTFTLLAEANEYYGSLSGSEREAFRFLHVSTDEVYGSLGTSDPPFSEVTPYAPNSPYSASKAASDHLVRAWHHTYGLPTVTTNCSNNYGPFQFPEKLIPLMILAALDGRPLPVYGDGQNVRDWLFVRDHCAAIREILSKGKVGEVYNVGGKCEKTNIEVVEAVCSCLDELRPKRSGRYADQVTFVKDRPGHDRRYAIDTRKIEAEVDWTPAVSFSTGIRRTIEWYLSNSTWVKNVQSGTYRQWIEKQYSSECASMNFT